MSKYYGVEALLLLAVLGGMLCLAAGFQFLLPGRADRELPSYQRRPFRQMAVALLPFGVGALGLWLVPDYRAVLDMAGIPLALLTLVGMYWLMQRFKAGF
ncbi:MAG: hypothetical protein MUC97_02885 [Bernardetiaceae bacterium]|jgi:hypothetical protein|nr:hypothetical protein [Bernardetiaceae bacterium]